MDRFGSHSLFGDLMPGKTGEQAAVVTLRAMTLALLAASRGLQHLHAHFGSDAATVALLAGRLTGIPFSYTAHARDIYHTYVDEAGDARMRRLKMSEAAFVATVSEYNRAYLQELAGSDSPARIERVYNGIDLTRFAFHGANGRAPDEILSVGRLIEKKGYFDLIEACRLLAERGRDFRCAIIGEGPLRDELDARIAVAGLQQQITLLGALPQTDVIARMRRATCLALPCIVAKSGDRDGLPTVLLEAQAIGLPSISTAVAGIPEIITDDEDGLLVPPEAPADLATALERMLADPPLRERLAATGRAKAERQFSLETNVALLRRHFLSVARQAVTA